MRKPLVTVLGLLAFGSLSLAAPRSDATAQMAVKDISGSLNFQCTAQVVTGATLKRLTGLDRAILTASHCLPDDMSKWDSTFQYVSFDEASYIRVTPLVAGSQPLGYDVALMVPHAQNSPAALAAYNAANPLVLSDRTSVLAGERLFNFGYPGGIGLSFAEGYVAQAEVVRPIKDDSTLNFVGLIAAQLPCMGGCSGSAITLADDTVIAVLVGGLTQDAFRMTYAVPVWKLFAMLADKKLQEQPAR